MAAVLLLVVAVAIWGYSWVRGQLANDAAGKATTVTVTARPTTARTTPTPSVQVATPVTPTPTSSTATTTATQTSTPPPATATTRPAVDLPRGARVCDGSSQVRAAAGTPRTSCTFALAVRDAWVAAGGGDRSITAHSSVTGQDYSMSCSGSPVTTCRGGNRAVVHLY
jgi:hypothetical protein